MRVGKDNGAGAGEFVEEVGEVDVLVFGGDEEVVLLQTIYGGVSREREGGEWEEKREEGEGGDQ